MTARELRSILDRAVANAGHDEFQVEFWDDCNRPNLTIDRRYLEPDRDIGASFGLTNNPEPDGRLSSALILLHSELKVLREGPMRRVVFDGYRLVMAMDHSLSWTCVESLDSAPNPVSTTSWRRVNLNLRHFCDAVMKAGASQDWTPPKPGVWPDDREFTYDTNTGNRGYSVAVRPTALELLRKHYPLACPSDDFGRKRLAQSMNSFRKAMKPGRWHDLLMHAGRMSSLWGCGPGEIGFSVLGMGGAFILRGDDYSSHT